MEKMTDKELFNLYNRMVSNICRKFGFAFGFDLNTLKMTNEDAYYKLQAIRKECFKRSEINLAKAIVKE